MKPVFTSRDFTKSRRSAYQGPRTSKKAESRLTKNSTRKQTQKTSRHSFFESLFNTIKGFFSKSKPPRQRSTRTSKLKKTRWQKFFKFCLICFCIAFIFIVILFVYFSKDLPSSGKIDSRFVVESTKIYDRTGTVLLYDIHGEEKRTVIPFSEMPDTIKHATIALEDHSFYKHFGVDFKAIVRAVISQVFGIGTRSGGSTITQQLIKNSVLTNERSLQRKIKEVILAIEVELKYSKDEIFEMYLNEIPYGQNAYGVQAAAQTYFGKDAKDLSYDEAAMLAALPQAPSRYSPYSSDRSKLEGRMHWAIEQMHVLGFISEEEMQTAHSADTFSKLARNQENINAPHFVIYVRDYLEEKYGRDYLENGGLKVITTLDWEKQQIAERIVKEKALSNKERYNAENAALVAIDPKNGDILSMVGSRDYFDEEIDGNVNVTIRDRQPGSSFKPYAYIEAFRKGYTPETLIFDVPTSFETGEDEPYTPKNYDGYFRGPVPLKEALPLSLNIPAVKILYLAGYHDVIQLAKRMGISTLNSPERYGLSLVLGGGEVKLIDHVAAFSVFANNGIKHEKRAILEIRDKDDTILEKTEETTGEQIIEENYVQMLSHILSNNKYRVQTFGANNPLRFDDRPVAAKTGTTNENRDAWTIGYTPHIAVGVWGGNNDNSQMNSGGVGANVAAPIFRDFINEAATNTSGTFPDYNKEEIKTGKKILDGDLPGKIERDVKVCQISKKKNEWCLETKHCPKKKEKTRTLISNIHNILRYVSVADPTGPLPSSPKSDYQYKNWESGVQRFYSAQEKVLMIDEPLKDCRKKDFDD